MGLGLRTTEYRGQKILRSGHKHIINVNDKKYGALSFRLLNTMSEMTTLVTVVTQFVIFFPYVSDILVDVTHQYDGVATFICQEVLGRKCMM